jgi:amino acid adenylation domain-containing protein
MQSVYIAPESKLTSIDFDPFVDGEILLTAPTIVPDPKLIAVDFDPFVDGEIQLTAPATASQQEIWLGVQMSHEANLACLLSQSLRFKGLLNTHALQTAFQQLVARHEALRMTFSADGMVLSIAKKIEFVSPIVDLSNLSRAEREIEIDRHQQQAVSQIFDLQHGPLFSTEIIKLSETEHLAILTVHHIICDGWSYGILIAELAQVYSALNTGTAIELEPVEYLSEYAFLEQEKSTSAETIATEAYWIQKFTNLPPILDLPADYPRPPIRTFDSACEDYTLRADLVRDIKQLGVKNGCSLMTTFLAAFEVFLYKITGQTEFTVGVPTSGQTATGKYNLVGHCVNFLPLRSRIDPDCEFGAYLRLRNREILDDYDKQDFTFGSLLKKLAIPRNASRVPLISAVFNIDLDSGSNGSQFDELTVEVSPNRSDFATFEFSINAVTATDGRVQLNCQYNPKLFKVETIRRRLSEFDNLLTALTQTADRSISNLSLLNAKEENQLLVEWNQTQTNYPQTCIHQLFEQQVELNSDAIALVLEREQLTYHELNQRANQLAHYLIKLGVKPEDLVGIAIERSLETIISILGILKAGGAYLPLDLASPPTRLAQILEDAQISILLTKQSTLTKLPPQPENRVICIDTEWAEIAKYDSTNPNLFSQSNNLAYVMYTSGSTGVPKGVCIPHQGVVRLVKATNYVDFSPQQIFLHLAPLAFDASTFEIWGSLLNGAKLILFPGENLSLANIGETIRQHQITTLWLTAGLFHEMVDEQLENLQSVRQLIAGGDFLSVTRVQKVLATLKNCQVINGYGPTENTTFTCCHPIAKTDILLTSVPIGKPISNTQVYILDAHLQPVPIGVAGELHTGGDGLALGYLNRPDLTQARFIPNPFTKSGKLYKTGDLARYLPDGSIEFLGRIDNQVKIRGFRVELGEIESVLAQHPSIRAVSVIDREDRVRDKRLVAYIVTDKSADSIDNLSRELRAFLQSKLPDYLIPSAFVEIDILPLTLNGKVDRRALPAPEDSRQASRDTFVSPRDDLELQLTKIWERVLGIQPIGITDNFFDLGGNSLTAVRLFAEIAATFEKNLPLSMLFKAPTIGQLAAVIRQDVAADIWSPLVEIKPGTAKSPLFCIHGGGFNILVYRDLALQLDADLPVYGLQARGLDSQQPLADSLEAMATDYINEIQRVQPVGPYLLAGLSNGGNIALEMAQQLHARGETVALVAMFDSYAPAGITLLSPVPRFLSSLSYALKYSAPRSISKLRQAGVKQMAINLKTTIDRLFRAKTPTDEPAANLVPPDRQPHSNENAIERNLNRVSNYILEHSPWSFFSPSAQLQTSQASVAETLKEMERYYSKIYKTYAPQPYPGKITIFQAIEPPPGYQRDPYLGWGEIAQGGVEIYKIPGNHTSMMESPILPEQMNICLDRVIDEYGLS